MISINFMKPVRLLHLLIDACLHNAHHAETAEPRQERLTKKQQDGKTPLRRQMRLITHINGINISRK